MPTSVSHVCSSRIRPHPEIQNSARLAIIEPSMENIRSCEAEHPLQLSPGLAELFDTLRERGTHVYLVSGGFRQMINPIADMLNISRDNIYANNILFKEDGSYNGFDKEEPTAWAGGKARVVGKLREEKGYETVFMVGDGATDMEARPPANHFIGFGGIAERKVVRDGACWYVTDLHDLITPLRQ
jgi:phosphoserine phosphatase